MDAVTVSGHLIQAFASCVAKELKPQYEIEAFYEGEEMLKLAWVLIIEIDNIQAGFI